MSRRCQRSNVSGVTIVATPRRTCRPSRCARAASCRSSSSVRRKRRPPSCRRSTRFSSIRYASISRSWRSSQLVTVRSDMRRAETSITDRSLRHCRHFLAFTTRSAETVGHYGHRRHCHRPHHLAPNVRDGLMSHVTSQQGQPRSNVVKFSKDFSAPSTTRTCDLLVRSQTLYPTELWARRDCPCPSVRADMSDTKR